MKYGSGLVDNPSHRPATVCRCLLGYRLLLSLLRPSPLYPHCRLKCRLQRRRHLLSWFQQRRKIYSAYPILSLSYSHGGRHDLVKSE
jgi:hypothetical protein